MTTQSYSCTTTDGHAGPFAIPTDLLIGEAWVPAASGKRIDILNPATEAVLTSVADASPAEGIAAVDAAAAAAADWAATPPRKRADILLACFHAMMAEQEWLAQLISLENGKALPDARGEVAYAAEFFRWYAEEAVRINGELAVSPSGANRIMVQYQPIGIALLITPWNFPAAMATRKIAPALAAGCTCILKPAEETPLTALAVAEIMRRAGVPAGVVNVVNSSDPGPLCSGILHDPRVRKLSFTGSTEVGRILLRQAADQVISSSMELGGNAPFLVLDDADIEEAIEGAMVAKMRNAGEACTAANRFYVQRGIHDAFVAKLAERMGAMKMGPGTESATQCGAMINRQAIDKIEHLVADAVARGAEVRLGGRTPEGAGFFYPPSVIANVQPGSEILTTEVFGPVAAVIPFDDPAEAVALANATEYGLAAYVYTADLKRGLQLAERIEAGMVAVNRGLVSDAAAPFGGVKQSGLGREGGHHGLLEYCEAKYIAVSW
ncbi:NAD-dependent succinate-semialdehyde dehydrogenase [Sphingobium fuliginis]|jgi:succinate-semialdehyde dehydrogenase/glutarate-semialdehyde dehydrogenase|uniref:NAD-dependent succinate-semialdehyde dehydrogenase n=1 Tax=Sphingobium fuliginis (strain ATCC 27551) TaxID=336203 RepID=A0A7M2GM94_SPHSA|nr:MULTISPECIES: NAD-dependent succinate-semialdehyde dehydrogenase [Sphingobium]KXU30533.1 NAD-dependent succinate-semialdehyde dehydrogenase [Sphingobium sp. AM]KYC30814.1 NAD-dependent succinate-semialdehyde dehydrogenase [Sphingobium sp. 22B]OAP30091.1 NAD-dependent succinate-semialdehyde dehydrogenase [Sphingobium sp. 20006FA]QOT73894.1 NAD-dependent succinate-semialdehyde dehydrogenase [Sphingobium fuliginis]